MNLIDERLNDISKLLDKHFNLINSDNRATESIELLSNLRKYSELFLYKVYSEEKNISLYQTFDDLIKVENFMKTFNNRFYRIHMTLNSVGHIFYGDDQSEALMIKYIPMLINMKMFLIEKYNFFTLESINKYPLMLDDSLQQFYRLILQEINNNAYDNAIKTKNLYYINKKAMRYIDKQVFYEYVLDVSDDAYNSNKFNTIIVYSKLNIDLKYDMIFTMSKRNIKFLNSKVTINVINDYEVFIRPCSFKALLKLINVHLNINSRSLVYNDLMKKMKLDNYSLLDIVENNIIFSNKQDVYTRFIDEVRGFINKNKKGVKVIRYLLLNMRYNVVKGQINKHKYKVQCYITLENPNYDGLPISSGDLGFEHNPIAFSPKIERPSIYELARLFDLKDYESELFYRKVEEYINKNNSLFVDSDFFGIGEDKIDELISEFNNNLYSYYSDYKLIRIYKKITIKFYYESTISVLKNISDLSKKCNVKLENPNKKNKELSEDKNDILNNAFKETSICIIIGSAGTGKTTLINEFLNLNFNKKIICITTTNTAKNHLKKYNGNNITYKNTSEYFDDTRYDLVVIDEAEFVSTDKMYEILKKYKNSNYLIVGDTNQLESINFGNWFKLAISLFKKSKFIYDLKVNHRASSPQLQEVWNIVRNANKDCENIILDKMSAYSFTKKISEKAFELNENQIVLCYGYDGIYGVNNVNRYLQNSNNYQEYTYQQNTYKIGDPIIFTINDYEQYGLYNNLKGTINNITRENNKITFVIELDNNIGKNIDLDDFIIECQENKTLVTVIRNDLSYESYDNELATRSKLPFQLAYAMTIHKAQGLEFDNVKIILTNDVEEYISKNIFYTAITRARKKLEIFWDPEVANRISKKIIEENNSSNNDVQIFKKLLGEKKIDMDII